MNKLILPIKKGERPLFKALELLETIYKDNKRGLHSYSSFSNEYIIEQVINIFVFIYLLKLRTKRNMRENSQDLFKQFSELPLFFTSEQVKRWEINKEWSNKEFIPYKEKIVEYENQFNTLTPSSLYQIDTPCAQYIWQQWFLKTDIKEIISTLEYSAKSLLEWNKHRTDSSHVFKNILVFSNKIGLSEKDAKSWYYLYIITKNNSAIFNLFLKEYHNEDFLTPLIDIWEEALSLEKNSIINLLHDDSLLIQYGFYKKNNIDNNHTEWRKYWNSIERIKIPNMDVKLLNQENFINLFLKKEDIVDNISIDYFSYIKGVKEVSHLIKNMKSGRILIYGTHLSGKKTLIKSILNSLSMEMFSIIHKDESSHDIIKKEKYQQHELRLADKLLSSFKNSALLIDNIEEKYDLNKSFDFNSNESLQIWTSSDITKINPTLLKKLDCIIEITPPYLNNRIELAKKIFNNENDAIKIAQTLKNPFDIIKVGKICHISNNFSWENISLQISTIKSLESLSLTQKINLNKLENEDDIIPLVGCPELEKLLKKTSSFYTNPQKYLALGAKANKGIILVGPPGTGKTHFARNLSKIVNIPIFAPQTTELSKNLESIPEMFNELKRNSPCILFLDEIDTLITNPKNSFGVDLEKQKIVNAFLTQIDGIETNDGILIIGATHRADNIDPAAIRSGRLNNILHLKLPNSNARKDIWKAHLNNKIIDKSINIEELVKLSVSFSCADIMEAANKAALYAAERDAHKIELIDFKIACDEVFWGYADNGIIFNNKDKEITAYHEAGHALIALYYGYNVPRITIKPRTNSLGAVHYTGQEGNYSRNINNIKEIIQISLAGICAEKVKFDKYSTGGSQDLEQAKKIILHAICEAGLGKEGPIYLGDMKFWSEQRKINIEQEEKNIMNDCFEIVENILSEHRHLLNELAQTLLDKKEISGSSIDYFKNKLISKTTFIIKQSINLEETVHNKKDDS